MKKNFSFSLFLACILLSGNVALAQRIVGGSQVDLDDNAGNHVFLTTLGSSFGVNATGVAPNNGALLDLNSTTKGLLLPRMNTGQEIGVSPLAGMLLYNTTTNTLDIYNGSSWSAVSSSPSVVTPVPEVVNFLGAFNPATAYSQNDLVSSTTPNVYFFSLTNSNTGNTPETSPGSWMLTTIEQLHLIHKTLTLSAPGFTSLLSIHLTGTNTAGGRIQYQVRATDGGSQIATEEGVMQYEATANSITCTVQITDKLHLGTVNSGCTPGFFNPLSQPGVSIFDNVSFSSPAPIVDHDVYFRISPVGGQYSGGAVTPIVLRLEP